MDVRANACSGEVRACEHYVDIRASDLYGSHSW